MKRDDELRRSPLVQGRTNRIVHHILSFSEASSPHLTSSALRDLSSEYIRLKDIEVQGLAVAHRSEGHVHIHIMENGCGRDGYANRLSKQRFAEIKNELQAYQQQKYPELDASVVEHGKGQSLNRSSVLRKAQKQALASLLVNGLGEKHASLLNIKRSLQVQSCSVYYRGGQPCGVMTSDGRKYRFKRLGVARNEFIRLERKERYLESLRLSRSRARSADRER